MPNRASSVHCEVSMSFPASLLSLQDTLERHPEAKQALLATEIARRECEIVLLRSHRRLLHVQLWSAFQTALIVGVAALSLGVALSGLVEANRIVLRIDQLNTSLPDTFLTRGIQRQIQATLPTSTLFSLVGDRASFWDMGDAVTWAVILAVIALVIQLIQAVQQWRASRRLKRGVHTTEEELVTLRSWMKE